MPDKFAPLRSSMDVGAGAKMNQFATSRCSERRVREYRLFYDEIDIETVQVKLGIRIEMESATTHSRSCLHWRPRGR